MSKFILDTRLSEEHYVICMAAINANVIEPDDLNEGRRTMAEQWFFWNHQPPLAAFPRPTAPHIMLGHANHAIDANSFNGAAMRLAEFYRAHGVSVVFEVPGEAWHFRPHVEQELKNAAARMRKHTDDAVWMKGESGKPVKFLKHQLYMIHDPQTKRAYFAAGDGKPDGGWSPEFTEKLKISVRAFQHDHKLKADGVVGPKTDKAIDKAYSKEMKRRRASAKDRAKARQAKAKAGQL